MDGDGGACAGNWLGLARELRRAALRVSCPLSLNNVGVCRVLSRTASRLEQTFSFFRHWLLLLSSLLSSHLILHRIRFPTSVDRRFHVSPAFSIVPPPCRCDWEQSISRARQVRTLALPHDRAHSRIFCAPAAVVMHAARVLISGEEVVLDVVGVHCHGDMKRLRELVTIFCSYFFFHWRVWCFCER